MMRTLVHLSDLHFGRVDDGAVQALLDQVAGINPDLIAVSGDLTQRARPAEFQAARGFLDALPGAKIVVPGNHDVPLYNLFARLRGLKRYRRYISRDLEPFYRDSELAVLGLNTARSLALKSGRINERQIDGARKRLCGLEASIMKMIVTHHPFEMPVDRGPSVGRARIALNRLSECRVDLFLAGHFHVSSVAPTTFNVPAKGYSSLIIQAGTALSTRTRSEHNNFNVIRVELPELLVERVNWNPEAPAFTVAATERFLRTPNGWGRIGQNSRPGSAPGSSSHKR